MLVPAVIEDPTTSVSLLQRLQATENPRSEEDWNRFVTLYTPLLVMWTRRRKLQESDVADLVQTIFVKVFQALPRLSVDPKQRFRGYLFVTALNAYRSYLTDRKKNALSGQELEQEVAAAESDVFLFEENEHRQYLLAECYASMEGLLSEKQQAVCRLSFQEGLGDAEISGQLQIPIHQVYTAKSRSIKKLKAELSDFLD